jgi:predicted  nucleic acid-binding Zn-ribbon protein
MDRAEPKRIDLGHKRPPAHPRADVQALLALQALDESADAGADLADRRRSIADRIPREALDVYEAARRRGLLPPVIATRGTVCWGCFHRLSPAVAAPFLGEEAFLSCPHCERLLFNPDWTERR